ncbi:HD domain-containing protein [Ruminococcaceae bacterium YRB3002]|nr:HD domain-containing protein [Ruminococcaceae bacterium YRB3002]
MENAEVNRLSRFKNARCLVLILVGIVINLLFADIASLLDLPLYLDSIGTVVVAALSGFIPGIIVGIATNLLKSFTDESAIYYGTINVFIAVVAAFAARHKYQKSFPKLLLTILACTFAGGVLGSILTWFLYGFANVGISSSLAQKIYDLGFLNEFMSQFAADVITDLCDKTITVGIATIVVVVLPDRIQRSFRLYGWRQHPLDRELKSEVGKLVSGGASLKTKLMVLISLAMITIAVAATSIGYVLYMRSLVDSAIRVGTGVAEYAAGIVDPDKVDDYIANGHTEDGYDRTEELLTAVKNSSPDIQYIYVYKIMDDGCHVVFDLDSEGVEGSEPGEIIGFEDDFSDTLPALLNGEPIEPIITNGSYGWLLTIYIPVYNSAGECVCYACTDISMVDLTNESLGYLAREVSLFLGVFVLILSMGLWLAHYNIIVPVNSMAVSAGNFAYDSDETLGESVERLKELDITTGDEIENLYHSFVKTSEDSVQYVNDIQNQKDTMAKMQSGIILVLADMVESRDECTGNHVRKTAAYSGVILEGLRELGYYTDIITDKYISDVINASPLHDIGKIKIPDRILNSQNKLSDEDFAVMKMHTIYGSEIISSVMENVPDAGYLVEAKNLAEFHHEKWNGKGYPHGLAGEDIPLSARVLAVADVFDALTSRRSYKEPFSFEKAVDIIKEGTGTSFDPRCVEAFLHMIDIIKNVSEDFYEMNNRIYDNGILH